MWGGVGEELTSNSAMQGTGESKIDALWLAKVLAAPLRVYIRASVTVIVFTIKEYM